MATYTWTGATNTSWATVTNWSPNPAVAIATGDSVIIPATATNDLLADLDRTGDAYGGGKFGLNLVSLTVVENSTVKIGTSTTPLMLTADAIYYRGASDFYFKCDADDSAQPTDKLIIDSTSLNNPIYITTTSAITRADFVRGVTNVTIAAGGLTYAHVSPRDGRYYDTEVTFSVSGVSPTNLYIDDGTVYSPGATLTVIGGGRLVNTSPARSSSFNYYTVYQTGGYFEYYVSGLLPTSPTGDPEIWLLGGTFDASKVSGSATGGGNATIGTIRKFPGGIFLKNNLLTITGSEITIGE